MIWPASPASTGYNPSQRHQDSPQRCRDIPEGKSCVHCSLASLLTPQRPYAWRGVMAHISPFHTLDQRLSPLQICTATVYEIFRLVGGVSVSKSCLAVTLPRHRRSTVSSQGEQRRTNLPYHRIACVESPRTMFVESVHTSTWLRGEKLVVAVCSKPARPASIPFMTENL